MAERRQLADGYYLEQIRDGAGDPVYFADGFTSTDRGWGDWQSLISARYPRGPVYRIIWPAGRPAAGAGALIGLAVDWVPATVRASLGGRLLAEYIAAHGKHAVVIGHSLGARIAAKAAYDIGKKSGRLRGVHLLGAAIVRAEGWEHLAGVATDGVWNYYSRNDRVIEELYWWADPRAHWTQPIGSRGFGGPRWRGVHDVDVSDAVRDHSDYTRRVALR